MTSPTTHAAPTFDRRASLFLGTDTPDGTRTVTPTNWSAFVSREIAPRFPSGYTVQDVTGGWQYQDGRTVTEPTRLLSVVFSHADQPAIKARLAEIAGAYRAQFRQESVLETIDHTEGTFL